MLSPFLGLTLCLLPTATAAAAPSDDAPVVVIDGKPIARGTYKQSLFERVGADYLDTFVNNYLIDLEAQAQSIAPTDKEAQAWIEEKIQETQTNPQYARLHIDPEELRQQYKPMARQFLVIETLIKRHRADPEQLKHEYDERFGEKRKVRHILYCGGAEPPKEPSADQLEAAKKKADDARERLEKGADFKEIAKKESDDKTSGAEGGELGEITQSTPFVPEFLACAFALKEGEISKPVKSQFGFHVIQVEKVSPPARPFDDKAKEELRAEAMKRQVVREEEQQFYSDLRKKHKIEKKLE